MVFDTTFFTLGLLLVLINMLYSDLMGPLFLVSALALMLYFIPNMVMEKFLYEDLVNPEYLPSFYLYIFLCLLAFTIGYQISNWQKPKYYEKIDTDPLLDFNKLNNYAVYTGILGFLMYSYFILSGLGAYIAGHNSGNFSVGGYVYEMRYFIFSSILMLYNNYLRGKGTNVTITLLVALTLFLVFDAWLQHQRGSWIRLMVIYGFSYGFLLMERTEFKSIKLYRVIGRYYFLIPLLPIPVLLLTFSLQARKYHGLPLSVQIEKVAEEISEDPTLLIMGSAPDEGNEFVFAVNAFQAREVSGVFDMGKKWLYPPMNFIPRALWKDKPHWNTYSLSVFDIIDEYGHIYSVPGAAETGIVESAYRFAWLTPLFFMALGFFSHRFYYNAIYGSLHSRSFYACFYVGLFYFITQNMLPFFIFTLYMYIPIYFSFRWAKKTD